MKKDYVIPTIEIIDLKNEDIITTSPASPNAFDPENIGGLDGDPWYPAP